MSLVTISAETVRVRARVELAEVEIHTLEGFALDARVRSVLVAANGDLCRLRQLLASEVGDIGADSVERSLDRIESRLRLVRRAICTLGVAATPRGARIPTTL